jgi:hypothetical protein
MQSFDEKTIDLKYYKPPRNLIVEAQKWNIVFKIHLITAFYLVNLTSTI